MDGIQAALFALGAGGAGGIINALMTDNGFIMPKQAVTDLGANIWRPGMFGNVLIGAIAALVSWGLYGSAAGESVMSNTPVAFTWAAMTGAILVGTAGARWLTSEVDKTMLKATAAAAASTPANGPLAGQLATLPPAAALAAAQSAKAESLRGNAS